MHGSATTLTTDRLRISYDHRADLAAGVLTLQGTATYHEAPALRRELLSAMAHRGAENLVVDLAAVERMDTAAMAVLVEGLLAAHGDHGPQLYFCSPSESVRKVFHLAGLDDAVARCRSCLADLEHRLRHPAS